ncbi:type II secretion system minor pseudopilin GspJ [Gammaproteobacteria bacterium AB-CW1]|uniref:Type II secretion system protein J n=1 Tax=Natronospira elongata TaxID=3110268 RepID=A0AAP6JET0_9GAMM|nr:type II secretion system minor pseudopilin GspJ [Gammaproteobacteria bacterium AB-CW1]
MIMGGRRQHRGFTLFEIMVAIAIFAILGVMTWTAMAGMVRQQELTTTAMERFRAVQQTMTLLTRDLEQIRPRPIRGASHGDFEPAVSGGGYMETQLEFTRGGVRNPLQQPRASLQRVGWGLDGDTLTRFAWPVLDRAPDTQPLVMPLLEDVVSLQVRFLDPGGEWQDDWPPAAAGFQADPFLMPRAMEIIIETEDMGRLRRVMEVPGVMGRME